MHVKSTRFLYREVIHPQIHFEIDLGLDSLARTECFASVEQTLGIEPDPQELSTVQKVGELVQLATSRLNGNGRPLGTTDVEFRWQKEGQTAETLPDVEHLLERKTSSSGICLRGVASHSDRSATVISH